MKKIICLLLAMTLALGLTACGGGKTAGTKTPRDRQPETPPRLF